MDVGFFDGAAADAALGEGAVGQLAGPDVAGEDLHFGGAGEAEALGFDQSVEGGVDVAGEGDELHEGGAEGGEHAFEAGGAGFDQGRIDLEAGGAGSGGGEGEERRVVAAAAAAFFEELLIGLFEESEGGLGAGAFGSGLGGGWRFGLDAEEGEDGGVIELAGPGDRVFAVDVFVLGVGAFRKQEFDDGGILVFARYGVEEGCHLTDVGGIDVSARIEQELDHGGFAMGGGEHERADAFEGDFAFFDTAAEGVLEVYFGAVSDQVFDEVDGATGGGVDGAEAGAIDDFGIGAGGEQEAGVDDRAGVAEGAEQRSCTASAGFVGTRAGLEEEEDAIGGAGGTGGNGEGVLADLGFGFDVGAFGEEGFDFGGFGGGGDEGGDAEGVGFVGVCAEVEEPDDCFWAALGGGPDEGGVFAGVFGGEEGWVLRCGLEPGEIVFADALLNLGGVGG